MVRRLMLALSGAGGDLLDFLGAGSAWMVGRRVGFFLFFSFLFFFVFFWIGLLEL